ncbi:MAG: hypothetical protein JSW26_04460 [Desulfobacterales bacterium]|nr:MAG: hypothetical protein JSW26_04460 [Desulfobacterales bacterium]
MTTLRKKMEMPSVHANSYRRFLDIMATQTVSQGYHRLITTNWDYLLQREVDTWIGANQPGYVPGFLKPDGMVSHLNGSIEPGNFQNRSSFLLETDSAEFRKAAVESNKAFNKLLWSNFIVIVGMSFECDIDKGLSAALKTHEDNLPIGSALFVVVDPMEESLERTISRLAACFPRACGLRVQKRLEEWIDEGMPELFGRIFM